MPAIWASRFDGPILEVKSAGLSRSDSGRCDEVDAMLGYVVCRVCSSHSTSIVRQVAKGKTKRAVVEAGLRMLLHLKGQEAILRLVGKVRWEGNLGESRQGRDLT